MGRSFDWSVGRRHGSIQLPSLGLFGLVFFWNEAFEEHGQINQRLQENSFLVV